MEAQYSHSVEGARSSSRPGATVRTLFIFASIAVVVFLASWNLTNYPRPWFDEGAHLLVPKALIKFGAYADYSSEGFRHYGPTIGVGPTVMLPIAGAFRLFGIGLLPARLVMVVYLVAAVVTFFLLAKTLGGFRLAWVATALFVTSQGIGLIEYGRQVLGEVPGLFFILAGLLLWFTGWERSGWLRLAGVGLLLGLGAVTKYQYLLVLAPALILSWVLGWLYFRRAPQRVFLIPGIVTALVFAAWQFFTLVSLGPSTLSENFMALREFSAGAAAVFSSDLMTRSLRELLSWRVFFWMIVPVVFYGAVVSFGKGRRNETGPAHDAQAGMRQQQWSVVFLIVALNLVWYITASVSWIRYAFLGLSLSALFVARFFHDLTNGFEVRGLLDDVRRRSAGRGKAAAQLALMGLLAAMIVVPGVRTVWRVVREPTPDSTAMAAYMNVNVPLDALVETWEPEMNFLTDHTYHRPPQLLLNSAVKQIWQGAQPVSELYDFDALQPQYVLNGAFARWVNVYPQGRLLQHYELVAEIGPYQLYRRK